MKKTLRESKRSLSITLRWSGSLLFSESEATAMNPFARLSSVVGTLTVAVGVLAGCGSSSSPTAALPMPQSLARQPSMAKQTRAHPNVCTPTVWASSLTNAVYGYTGPGPTPTLCVTLTSGNSIGFNAPITVAIGQKPQWLYVADLNNDRIVVFTYKGVYVKWLDTDMSGTGYQPWGVCVSSAGVVGVANRQYNNTGAAGIVEFFKPTAVSGSGPTGDADGVLGSDNFCAFDKRGNFFVDGAANGSQGGGQQIAYLSKSHVGIPSQTLVNSGLGNASYWVGMYSRIDSPVDDTLSVGASVGTSSTENVLNWKVSGPPAGPLTFTSIPGYSLTSYPATTDAVYQIAPSHGGSTGTLYVADYGDNVVLEAPANGGAVSTYASVSSTTGVATRPTGQY